MSRKRWLWFGGGGLAAGAVAYAATRRGGKSADEKHDLPRATSGPLISDEQWDTDKAYINASLRPVKVWNAHDRRHRPR